MTSEKFKKEYADAISAKTKFFDEEKKNWIIVSGYEDVENKVQTLQGEAGSETGYPVAMDLEKFKKLIKNYKKPEEEKKDEKKSDEEMKTIEEQIEESKFKRLAEMKQDSESRELKKNWENYFLKPSDLKGVNVKKKSQASQVGKWLDEANIEIKKIFKELRSKQKKDKEKKKEEAKAETEEMKNIREAGAIYVKKMREESKEWDGEPDDDQVETIIKTMTEVFINEILMENKKFANNKDKADKLSREITLEIIKEK